MDIINTIKNIVRRARITLTNQDSDKQPYTQVTFMGKTALAQTISPYGLFTQAPLNSFVLLFNVNANEENLAGIPYLAENRFKDLKPGEVAIANTLTKTFIKLTQEGTIEIECQKDLNINVNGNVNIDATTTTITGQVNLGQGGQRIARLGDQVQVGSNMGTIISAGTNTSI